MKQICIQKGACVGFYKKVSGIELPKPHLVKRFRFRYIGNIGTLCRFMELFRVFHVFLLQQQSNQTKKNRKVFPKICICSMFSNFEIFRLTLNILGRKLETLKVDYHTLFTFCSKFNYFGNLGTLSYTYTATIFFLQLTLYRQPTLQVNGNISRSVNYK